MTLSSHGGYGWVRTLTFGNGVGHVRFRNYVLGNGGVEYYPAWLGDFWHMIWFQRVPFAGGGD